MIGLTSTLFGKVATGIVIDEQVEFAHAFRNGHQPKPLVAEGRPTWDPEELLGRKGAFDTLGKAKPAAAGHGQPDCAGSKATQRALGAIETRQTEGFRIQGCAMKCQYSFIVDRKRVV